MSSANIAGRLRRLAPLAHYRVGPPATLRGLAERVAAEVGVDPSEIEAEAARIRDAADAAGVTSAEEMARFISRTYNIDMGELEAEARRLAGRARGGAWSG